MKQKLLSAIVILLVLLGLFFGGKVVDRAQAAGTICYVDTTATGSNDGSTWPNAYMDLQAALADPLCMVSGSEIHVAAGTYYPTGGSDRDATFLLHSGVAIIGGYPEGGGDTPDPTANVTNLSGDIGATTATDNSLHVVTGSGVDASAILDGFTIQRGYDDGLLSEGGGIYINTGSPSMQNLVLVDNTAIWAGGGIYLNNSTSTIKNVTVSGCSATMGGGLYKDGTISPNLTGVTFTGNSADEGGGAMINGNASLTGVTFLNNIAGMNGAGLNIMGGSAVLNNVSFTGNIVGPGMGGGNGGGMFSKGGASPSLTNVTFSNNSAHAALFFGGNGGGMYSDGNPSLDHVNFLNNHADAGGGGLWVNGNITMIDSRVDGNSASEGGGLSMSMSGSTGEFINVAITNNSVNMTDQTGGGVYTVSSAPHFTNLLLAGNSAWRGAGMANYTYSDPVIVNATIYGNHSADGGSAFSTYNSAPTIINSIVWGNTETTPGPDFLGIGIYDFPTINYSLLEDAGCPGTGCTGLLHSDPQFIDPANGDYRLPPLSSAVDAGDIASLPADQFDLDGDGNLIEYISQDGHGKPRIVLGRVDLGAYESQVWNANWTQATTLTLNPVQPDVSSVNFNRYVDLPGQSRWYRFLVQPDSKVIVTLTNLPANYDLALYRDISQVYSDLTTSQDLLQLSAEFAPDTFSPDTFSPDTFSPDTFSPDTFSPDTFSPDTFSPDTFSPDTFSPDTFSPDTFSPDTFSPDTFSPDTFSPDTFSPDTFSPDTFSPDTFSPDTFSPDTFSSAQTRSMIAVSAHDGTQGEGIIVNTWTKSGYFYVRVRGRNGVYDANSPFHLQVMLLSGSCGSVSTVLGGTTPSLPQGGNYQTLILTNLSKTEGSSAEKTLMQTKLSSLAGRTSGWVQDVGGSGTQVNAFSEQAQAHPACVYAMNLQASSIKGVVDGFRAFHPELKYIVLVGNDHAIPFFRYTDSALLASEIDYSPPVLDDTTSQASLKSGYTLSQDAYGASKEISYKASTLPVPDLPVGRLVETASDINHLLDAYLGTVNGVVVPANALVTGYDFLADDANAVKDELAGSLGAAKVASLISANTAAPADSWTADQLRQNFLGSRHDINFLAGHFSANSALAADYKTRLAASEVLASTTNLINSLVYSAGCHSGYNIVNADDVPGVTQEPDWAQVFAAKGATFIGGTGYQYGDTDFIEYSERLYLEFTKQLRYGSGPVAVGDALVQAKQAYLAATPLMRGIHEKTVLEATLFGLPMLQFNLPGRIPAPVDTSLVTGTTTFSTNPGSALGLEYAELNLNYLNPDLSSTLLPHTVTLHQDDGNTLDAFYLEGPDGVMVNPSEPVLPLDLLNVTSPDSGYVLRGVGWLGGSYTNLTDCVPLTGCLPLTGAATEDLRAPHTPFFSDTFYPVRPWNINYFDALDSTGGPTRLSLMLAQYRSTTPGSQTGVLRRFDTMDFRLYYSGNISSYTNPDPNNGNWTNTPALSAPPDISHISSSINPDGTVSFEVTVTGDPAAGIQEVWLVYTFENGAGSGTWLPLQLHQDISDPPEPGDDSRLWMGSLVLDGAVAGDLRYVVQAVNGVGLVTMMTNQGQYYQAGVDPAAVPQGLPTVVLTFESPAANGAYGSQQEFTAYATNDSGTSLPNLPITFSLGGQSRLVVTGGDGRATTNFFLASQPGDYTLTAAFTGNDSYAPATTSSPFTLGPGSSSVVLAPKTQNVLSGSSAQFSAVVMSSGVPLTGKPVALTLTFGGVIKYTGVATTDYSGQASWQVPVHDVGSYSVKAWFALPVSTELDLSSAYYTGASDTGTLVVQPRTGLAIQYSGDTYLAAGTTSGTLGAQLSGPSLCLSNQTVTFKQDTNGDGTYETTIGTQKTNSSGLASYPLSELTAGTIYEIEVSVADGNCNAAVNTGTLMVAGSGDASNGGGYYNINGAGRINFGYTLQVKATKTGTTVSGQILWHVQGKTRLKGTITAYNKACPSGTTAPSGTTCAYLTGTGNLYSWNSTTNRWTLTATNVGFQVTVADGGSSTSCNKKNCSTALKPDFFRMNMPSVDVTGESMYFTQLKGGNIVVK